MYVIRNQICTFNKLAIRIYLFTNNIFYHVLIVKTYYDIQNLPIKIKMKSLNPITILSYFMLYIPMPFMIVLKYIQ